MAYLAFPLSLHTYQIPLHKPLNLRFSKSYITVIILPSLFYQPPNLRYKKIQFLLTELFYPCYPSQFNLSLPHYCKSSRWVHKTPKATYPPDCIPKLCKNVTIALSTVEARKVIQLRDDPSSAKTTTDAIETRRPTTSRVRATYTKSRRREFA